MRFQSTLICVLSILILHLSAGAKPGLDRETSTAIINALKEQKKLGADQKVREILRNSDALKSEFTLQLESTETGACVQLEADAFAEYLNTTDATPLNFVVVFTDSKPANCK